MVNYGYSLKRNTTGFTDGLDVEMRKREESRVIPKFLAEQLGEW